VVDLTQPDAVRELFASLKARAVVHTAAAGVRQEADAQRQSYQVNVLGTLNLAWGAKAAGVEHFVHFGSGFEYKPVACPITEGQALEPVNFYGVAKAAASQALLHFARFEGLPLTILRPFSVYGPGEATTRFIPYVITKALRREAMEFTLGLQVRDYLYVEDVAEAVVAALRIAPSGKIYNLGAGFTGAANIRQLVGEILEICGAPAALATFGVVKRSRPEPPCFIADTTAASLDLGWWPTTGRREGLEKTVRYYDAALSAAEV